MGGVPYWGFRPAGRSASGKQKKGALDRLGKRGLYVDCTPRGEDALLAAIAEVRRFRPHVMVAYASGAGVLARFVNDRGLRTWDAFPVLTGAEGLVPHDRAAPAP